jgi:hypothetical protein
MEYSGPLQQQWPPAYPHRKLTLASLIALDSDISDRLLHSCFGHALA